MNVDIFKSNFQINLPIAANGIFWNGRADEFNNIGHSLEYSQEFGLTPYAKKGIYGYYNGQPRPHNGHDFAGALGTPLVAPCRCWCSFVGWDPDGYGNYCFTETETKTINGDNIKMEFVIAHMKEVTAVANKWYDAGKQLGLMGSTGMSTGPHMHFSGRPLIVKNGKTEWAVNDQAARGYVDLTDFFITKPIYNKQILINQRMELIKKEGGDNNIYAIDPKGRACLILNWVTYQLGVDSGLWKDEHKMVKQLPPMGPIIIMTPNN